MKKSKKSVGLSDERFSHVQSDPKFSGLNTANKKVTIDKRFAAALTDEKFSARAPVDKRGRKMKRVTGNDLLDLYDVEDEKEEPSAKKRKQITPKDDSLVDNKNSDDEKPVKVDLARGEGNISSSSDDESDSDWELPDNVRAEMALEDLDHDVDRVEWASKRLAACNLDWDLVKADDILILVSSFKPPGGHVVKVSVYLSDFGKERLEEEEKSGPRLHLPKPIEEYDEMDEKTIDPDTLLALRKYQLDRLKYYYAVIECDTEQTASAIYEQCDGFQFESSGLKMDLRFVPDDMIFEEDRLKEQISEDDVNLKQYQSKENTKSSIISTGARLDWDENDEMRTKKFRDAFNDEDADGLIASDSDDEATIAKRKEALLSLLGDNRNNEGLQVEWETSVPSPGKEEDDDESDDDDFEKALARRNREGPSDDENEEEPKIQEKKTTATKKTGYQLYLEKRRQKKKDKKQKQCDTKDEEEVNLAEVEKDAKERQKQERARRAQKEKVKTDAAAETVAGDDRFKALFTDSAFAIDQSSKHYKGSKLIEKQASVRKTMREEKKSDNGDDLVSKLKAKANRWKK